MAQFVFAEPGPEGQFILNTRLGCEAKVRNVLASAADGGLRVRSLLFTYIPSPTASGPPINAKVVFVVTSELHPLPSVVVHVPTGIAAGSLLKIKLLTENVAVPVDPESKVLITLAEASETKTKPPARTRTGTKANHRFRNLIRGNPSISMPLPEIRITASAPLKSSCYAAAVNTRWKSFALTS